jgi:hypothetical protein
MTTASSADDVMVAAEGALQESGERLGALAE